ncbi:MAG: DMT family transporter [Armatimonadota bacterium]|nr:DMT family transporter [Armatimonadota bacterium]
MSAYLLLVLGSLFSGGVFVAGKFALASLPPLTVAWGRFAVASLVLWAWVRWTAPAARRLTARDLPMVVAMGVTAMAGFNILLFYGLTMAPAADAALISPAVSPILTALLAQRFLGERIGARGAAGLVAGIAGLALVIAPGGGGSGVRLAGDLLFAAGSALWGVYALIVRAASRRFAPPVATLYACVAAALVLAPLAAAERGWAALAAATPGAWAGLLYLAVFPTALAFVFFHVGLMRLGATSATSFALLIPVFGVVLAAVVLGERLAARTVLGGALVVAGLWLVQSRAVASGGTAAAALRSDC